MLLFFLNLSLASYNYNIDMQISLEKNVFNENEKVKGTAKITNFEDFALYDGYLVLEVVKGNQNSLSYPSQFSVIKDGEGTIIYEKVLPVALPPKAIIDVKFEIDLPRDLKKGTYTLDAYFKNGRIPAVGIVHIFSSPKSLEFEVLGKGNKPDLSIDYEKTTFNGIAGPIGAPVMPKEEVKGIVFVKNFSRSEQKGIVVVKLCDWDDTICLSQNKFISEVNSEFTISPNSEKSIELKLIAPEIPSAYAVRIEIQNEKGNLLALYRNRLIVKGGTARIWKLDFRGNYLSVLIGSSPDHYTYPDFSDFKVIIEAIVGTEKIFSKEKQIEKLGFYDEFLSLDFDFVSTKNIENFLVCAKIEKNSVIYDYYCYEVKPIKENISPKGRVEVKATYSDIDEKLFFELCGFNEKNEKQDLNAKLTIIDLSTGSELSAFKVEGVSCKQEYLRALEGDYLYIVDDFLNKTQISEKISVKKEVLQSCSALGAVECNAECSGTIVEVNNTKCCLGFCNENEGKIISINDKSQDVQNNNFVLMILAIGLGIFIVGVYLIVRKRNSYSGEFE
ncbi:MAG: hypothetical protein QXI10_02215 [Candidatus Diapherotrites archaeon]